MNPGLKGIMAKLETADQYIVAVANGEGMTVLVQSSDGFIFETIKELAEEMADNHECEHCSCKDFAESFKDGEPEDLEEEVTKLQAKVAELEKSFKTIIQVDTNNIADIYSRLKDIENEMEKQEEDEDEIHIELPYRSIEELNEAVKEIIEAHHKKRGN